MSSKSKKKDKKKSKTKNDKIKLEEISAEVAAPPQTTAKSTPAKTKPQTAARRAPAKTASQSSDEVQDGNYKVKVIPALASQTNAKYEETTAAALNSAGGDGYELVSVLPSADSKKLVAFFKLSK